MARSAHLTITWLPASDRPYAPPPAVFSGPLPRVLAEALDHIDRNYLDVTVIKHGDRPEATRVANFSLAAVREALAVAVAHADTSDPVVVDVTISPTELCVHSPTGHLDPSQAELGFRLHLPVHPAARR